MHKTQTPNLVGRQARREANEQVSVLLLGAETDVMIVLCECGSADCDAELTLQREAYRRIRLKGSLFVVHDGHEDEAARVVSRTDGFAIVDAA